MPHVSYIANGFCARAEQPGDLAGMCELRFWNPTGRQVNVRMRAYYSDRAPVDLPEYAIDPGADPLLVFPDNYPEQFDNCGAWGMKLVSDGMVLGDHILAARREGPPDNVKYRGGCGDILLKTRPSRLWYFPDGIRLIWDPDNAPWPFNEFEWYHILNPNTADARVVMRCMFAERPPLEVEHTVGAERVLRFDNFDLIQETIAYGIRFASDQPVIVESERFIYGLHGLDEWGAYIHCQRPGAPAPLEWNEDALGQ